MTDVKSNIFAAVVAVFISAISLQTIVSVPLTDTGDQPTQFVELA